VEQVVPFEYALNECRWQVHVGHKDDPMIAAETAVMQQFNGSLDRDQRL